MTRRVIRLIDSAAEDLNSGKRFYDGLQEGIGRWFYDSLMADIEALQVHAGVHERLYGYYRMLAKRFPYAVYYDLDTAFITVMAILPLRRDPAWISEQVDHR